MTRRNIHIADSVWDQLKIYSKANGMKVAEVVRRAIIEFLRKEKGNE